MFLHRETLPSHPCFHASLTYIITQTQPSQLTQVNDHIAHQNDFFSTKLRSLWCHMKDFCPSNLRTNLYSVFFFCSVNSFSCSWERWVLATTTLRSRWWTGSLTSTHREKWALITSDRLVLQRLHVNPGDQCCCRRFASRCLILWSYCLERIYFFVSSILCFWISLRFSTFL